MKKKKLKPRDPFIQASYSKEIDMGEKVVLDKKKYSRKEKYKFKYDSNEYNY